MNLKYSAFTIVKNELYRIMPDEIVPSPHRFFHLEGLENFDLADKTITISISLKLPIRNC